MYSTLYWISSRGCVALSNGGVFCFDKLGYIDLVLFDEGLDIFSSLVESSFRPLVILRAVADLSFRPTLVMANSGGGLLTVLKC